MARSTGFEPAISSVTGRRDNPFTTSACVGFDSNNSIKDYFLAQGVERIYLFHLHWYNNIRKYAAVAQLVERRFRKA